MVSRPYGRFYYIPNGLQEAGHQCVILLVDFKSKKNCQGEIGKLPFRSIGVSYKCFPEIFRVGKELIASHRIDCIIGCSDTWFGILARSLAKKMELPYVVDAYDNYESYIPWLKPLHWLWRRSIRDANAVVSAGPALANLLNSYRNEASSIVPMSADDDFTQKDKIKCREHFNLPQGKVIVGYCGKLESRKGGSDLYEIAKILSEDEEFLIVVSGNNQGSESLNSNLQFLGYLEDAEMPYLVNALDIMLILNHDNAFGRYSYPIKIYEAMRCNTIPLSSDLPGTRWILNNHLGLLVEPGDANQFAAKIRELKYQKKEFLDQETWRNSVKKFEKVLIDVLSDLR